MSLNEYKNEVKEFLIKMNSLNGDNDEKITWLYEEFELLKDLMIKMLEPLCKREIAEQIGIAYGTFIKENKNVSFDFPIFILVGDSDITGKVKKNSENCSFIELK